jgi:hypothetical protein
MAYRGEDLDLRTPQGWSSSSRDAGEQANWWTRSTIYKGGRGDPLWVDENVMACCNHAYDLAVAHRATEVRLEHLINALTLSDTASRILEARGLSIASLRRESGATIANDLPATSGPVNPKRSEALKETLRLAADRAYPRRSPVAVDDLLHVLFDMRRDLPGAHLLHRHASAYAGRNGADLRLEPLPHLARPSQGEPRYAPPRYASQAAHDYFGQAAREVPPPTREMHREPVRSYREAAPSSTVDSLQNNRIEALERVVRDLGVDLADDRKSLQALVADLQRTTMAQADDSGRFRGNLTDRLASLEDALLRSQGDHAAMPGALLDRLTAIERGVEARLADVSRLTMQVVDRLASIEQGAGRPVEATLSPLVSQRLETITAFGSKIDALERTFQVILDRLTGLERKMDSASEVRTVDLAPIQSRLTEMERNVVDTLHNKVDLTPVSELMTAVEARVSGLERTLENRSAETGRTVSFIGDRLRSFDEAIGGQRSEVTERLGQLERALTAFAESSMTNGNGHERELTEVHEALLKLNANQQTLAGSLDQWRLDSTGDLSVISNRLKAIEESDKGQDPRINDLAAQVATIHTTLAKREVRKARFRHWLFGTDEWYSSSYDTDNWRKRHGEKPVADIRPAVVRTAAQASPTPPAPPPSILRR